MSCRIPSSSSEDGAAAGLTESDLSDFLSDSRALSAGEEEPPTKRKRDKALKTAAERNRKSGRMKVAARALSPKSSAVQKVQSEEIALVQDVKEPISEKACAGSCIPESEDYLVAKNNGEAEETEQHLDRSPNVEDTHTLNEVCRVGIIASEVSDNCVTENATTDKVDKTTDSESVLSAHRHSGPAVDDVEVPGKKECRESDSITVLADAFSAGDSRDKECTGVEQNSCLAEDRDVGTAVNDKTDGRPSGQVADNSELNADHSKDKIGDDEQAVSAETHGKKDDGCEHDKTHCSDDGVSTTRSNTRKNGDKLDKPANKSAPSVPPACNAKKMRGRPKKSNKKGRKKRVHSNVANTASVTEVQETDYEPTKKHGRPSKKSKLAQLAAEGCDSLPQSEDDIPLIELRRSARANKGQRKIDQLILEQPKKRNRAKDEEKERKRAAKEEKRRKREAELQEQAALKAKKVRNEYSHCL